MTTKTIRIPRGAKIGSDQEPIYGWLEMEADCEGGLAVHKSPDGFRPKWRVTHAASGLRMNIDAETKRRALQNREAALALPVDWTAPQADVLDVFRQSRNLFDELRRIGA